MKVATGKRTAVKEPRTQCPSCMKVYMQNAYILCQDEGRKQWVRIGKHCPACRHYIPDKQRKGRRKDA